jgi:hypothetical protein
MMKESQEIVGIKEREIRKRIKKTEREKREEEEKEGGRGWN